MKELENYDLLEILKYLATSKRIPFLGICLGMQLLFESSLEGSKLGLSIMKGKIKNLSNQKKLFKIPNIGFNKIINFKKEGIFTDFQSDPFFYFTHSYALFDSIEGLNYAESIHDKNFISAFQYQNICATQFHPEKSQSNGLKLLYNFFSEVK